MDAAGNAIVAQWRNATAVDTGVRGGDYYFGVDNLRVSGRGFAAYASAARSGNFGWRGARGAVRGQPTQGGGSTPPGVDSAVLG